MVRKLKKKTKINCDNRGYFKLDLNQSILLFQSIYAYDIKSTAKKKKGIGVFPAVTCNLRFAWPSVSIVTEDQTSLYFLPTSKITYNERYE